MSKFLIFFLIGIPFSAEMETSGSAEARDYQMESAENEADFVYLTTATGSAYNQTSTMLNKTEAVVDLQAESDADLKLATKWDFFKAVGIGNTDIVEELLKAKADVNQLGRYGFSALRLAAMREHVDTVKVLLRANAEVNHFDISRGRTALIEAVIVRNFEIVKVLLEAGADANHRSSIGNTALHYSVENGSTLIFKELVRFKADVNVVKQSGTSTLRLAVLRSNADIVRISLIAGADVNQLNNRKESALIRAVVQSDYEMSRLLLYEKADVNHVDDDGFSALRAAVDRRHVHLVELLVVSGADTSRFSREEIVKRAIKKKKDMGSFSDQFSSMFGFFQTLPDDSTTNVFEIVKGTVEVSLLDQRIFKKDRVPRV